jgi:hypothetical protein
MDYADLFNRKLQEFFQDLEEVGIERVQEYPLLKASSQLLASMDKQRPAEVYNKYVAVPYEVQITNRDETFFWNESFSNVKDVAIVHAIKQIWQTLDDANKDAIWKHLQVLLILARKATSNPV